MTGLEFLLTQCLYPRDEHPKQWDKYVYDSEFLHNVILKILMEIDPHFAEKILKHGVPITKVHVKHEPEHGLFDLFVKADNANYYVEIKTWSTLTEKQFNNQTNFLKENNARGVYILLANAADRWPNSMINDRSSSCSHVTNIGDLLSALNVFEIAKPSLKEIEEIVTAYRVVLEHLKSKR